MTIVSVRISDKEKKLLLKYGTLSEAIREGISLYLGSKESENLFKRLRKLQSRYPIRTASSIDLGLIKEDRSK